MHIQIVVDLECSKINRVQQDFEIHDVEASRITIVLMSTVYVQMLI